MTLGVPTLTAVLAGDGQWVQLNVACTGMTICSVYRLTSDGTAVRGAYRQAASGTFLGIDYEAPQNTSLTYYAKVTDGVSTRDSAPVTVDGMLDRGGDVMFGIGNPLAYVDVSVLGFSPLTEELQRDTQKVIGRKDKVVGTFGPRSWPEGTLQVMTQGAAATTALGVLLRTGMTVALSVWAPTVEFDDTWYLAVGDLSTDPVDLPAEPDRIWNLPCIRVSPPPSIFLGPAFTTWDDLLALGLTWDELAVMGTTWDELAVLPHA